LKNGTRVGPDKCNGTALIIIERNGSRGEFLSNSGRPFTFRYRIPRRKSGEHKSNVTNLSTRLSYGGPAGDDRLPYDNFNQFLSKPTELVRNRP